MNIKGLGDTLENFFKYTGIKWLFGLFYKKKDCGCKKRQETLNRVFPYKGKK